MADPTPPKLPHPATTPRSTKSGRQQRERPFFRESGGEDFGQWEVEVTPLSGTSNVGAEVGSGPERVGGGVLLEKKRGVLFEIRAAFYGPGLPEFGSQPNTRLIPHTHTNDPELAKAIAGALVEVLRSGGREIDIVQLTADVERRRAG
jgi:hypothetical protein